MQKRQKTECAACPLARFSCRGGVLIWFLLVVLASCAGSVLSGCVIRIKGQECLALTPTIGLHLTYPHDTNGNDLPGQPATP